MEDERYLAYRAILRRELVPAQGCTEPAAVAYAAARARQLLGAEPEEIRVVCSGNVIKNVMGVVIPHSGSRRGVEVAAILGALGGDPERGLEVLESVTEEHAARVDGLLGREYCRCSVFQGKEKLFVSVTAIAGGHRARVDIESSHRNITRLQRDDTILLDGPPAGEDGGPDKACLNLRDIFTYAQTEEYQELRELLEAQASLNAALAEEGLRRPYGARVGQTLLESGRTDPEARACALAAAAADARMGGCPLPVVINSGSGNQGIAASVPVVEYARCLGAEEERMYRALALSNLTVMLQKRDIGNLSAYCGAVCAACGAGAGIAYLRGGGLAEVERTVVNTLGTIGGMVCDGAKASCAAKVAAAVQTALLAGDMALKGRTFQPGEGIVGAGAEDTVRNMGTVAREGMLETDRVILRLMLEQGGEKKNSGAPAPL